MRTASQNSASRSAKGASGRNSRSRRAVGAARAAQRAARVDEVAAVVRPAARLAGVAVGRRAAVRAAAGDVRLVRATARSGSQYGSGRVRGDDVRRRRTSRRKNVCTKLGVAGVAARADDPVEVARPAARQVCAMRVAVVVGDLLGAAAVRSAAHGHVALVVVQPGGHDGVDALGGEVAAQHVARDVGPGQVADVQVAVRGRRRRGDPDGRSCASAPRLVQRPVAARPRPARWRRGCAPRALVAREHDEVARGDRRRCSSARSTLPCAGQHEHHLVLVVAVGRGGAPAAAGSRPSRPSGGSSPPGARPAGCRRWQAMPNSGVACASPIGHLRDHEDSVRPAFPATRSPPTPTGRRSAASVRAATERRISPARTAAMDSRDERDAVRVLRGAAQVDAGAQLGVGGAPGSRGSTRRPPSASRRQQVREVASSVSG